MYQHNGCTPHAANPLHYARCALKSATAMLLLAMRTAKAAGIVPQPLQ